MMNVITENLAGGSGDGIPLQTNGLLLHHRTPWILLFTEYASF